MRARKCELLRVRSMAKCVVAVARARGCSAQCTCVAARGAVHNGRACAADGGACLTAERKLGTRGPASRSNKRPISV